MATSNYKKHTSNNPVQKFLVENFFKNLISLIKGLEDSRPFDFSSTSLTAGAQGKIEINSILDVGCGEGFTLDRLSKLKKFKRLEGIEYSEEAIILGKKIHPELLLKKGDITKLEYEDKSFDLVVCTEVLEHLDDPKKALRELLRVSKKYILLSVPNEPFFRLSNFFRGKNLSRFGNDIGHIQHWSSRGFEKFVQSGNVKILKKKTPFPWTMVLVEKEKVSS